MRESICGGEEVSSIANIGLPLIQPDLCPMLFESFVNFQPGEGLLAASRGVQHKRAVNLTARDKFSKIDEFLHSGKKYLSSGGTCFRSNEKRGEDIRTIVIGLEFNDDPSCRAFKAP